MPRKKESNNDSFVATKESGSTIIQMGAAFKIFPNQSMTTYNALPAGFYDIAQTMSGYILTAGQEMTINHRIYGTSLAARVSRITKTFNERDESLGVLMSGIKGTGKSLAARMAAIELVKQGYPVIVVKTPYADEEFKNFIEMLNQPIVMFFDEFEKMYDKDAQTHMLSFFSGTSTNKRLFLLTINDLYKMQEHFINRPGRLHYLFKFDGLDADFIIDYCNELLAPTNAVKCDDILTAASAFSNFTFDILKAIVEEANRFPEDTIKNIISVLNVRADGRDSDTYNLVAKFNGRQIRILNPVFQGDPMSSDYYRDTLSVEISHNDEPEVFAYLADRESQINEECNSVDGFEHLTPLHFFVHRNRDTSNRVKANISPAALKKIEAKRKKEESSDDDENAVELLNAARLMFTRGNLVRSSFDSMVFENSGIELTITRKNFKASELSYLY